jgi:type IV secretion system protein TrbE
MMLRLDRVIKPWKEADALNSQINLFGFWNETAFLTKSGDLGMVLRAHGIDYESLDNSEQDYAVKRLESAFKGFGVGFHVYQYLFKSNRPEIPFATYNDPLIDAAIDQRRESTFNCTFLLDCALRMSIWPGGTRSAIRSSSVSFK